MQRDDENSTSGIDRRQFLKDAGATATGVALAGCLGGPSGPGADAAYYHAYGPTLTVKYDTVMAAAQDAGYTVDEPYYVGTKNPESGFHPTEIAELDARLGPDYRVFGVTFFYTQAIFLEAWFSAGAETTTVSVFDERVTGDFDMTSLPPDDWLRSRLTLLFEMDGQRAREYVTSLKDAINEGTDIPAVEIDEAPTFPRTYQALTDEATNSTGSDTGGDGWYELAFYDEQERFAAVDFVIQSMKISQSRGKHLYTIKLDRLGGFNLTIELPPREEIPEDEYRAVFRQMFTDVGLPPAVVEDLTFEYTPTVW